MMRTIAMAVLSVLLVQCNFEKEVEINLPEYPNTPYLECYLEPGKPYRLLAYYSIGYFDELAPTFIRTAIISITHRGSTVSLPYDSIPRDGDLRFYNYRSDSTEIVPAHYYEPFELSVQIDGKTYSATTTIVPAVPIDTVTANCNDALRCQLGIRFKDNPATADYYRYITFSDSLGGEKKQDFVLNDELFNSESSGIGGGFSFNEGQRAVVRLYHIPKEYYDFLVSVDAARGANGNPFAQPANIKSNIPGMIGIFAGLTYDSKNVPSVRE